MDKRYCVITGASSGIGLETAAALAAKGYSLILVNRDSEKSRDALEFIRGCARDGGSSRGDGGESIHMVTADLSVRKEVELAASRILELTDVIDVLILNAGIYSRTPELSVDGIEMTLAVNYFASFLLTERLLSACRKAGQGRIIYVTSAIYPWGRTDFQTRVPDMWLFGTRAYSTSKLYLVLLTRYLSEHLKDSNVTVNCVHPGFVAMGVFRDFPQVVNTFLSKVITSPQEGAKPLVMLADDPEVSSVTGAYFDTIHQKEIIDRAQDLEVAEGLWEWSQSVSRDQ